MTKVIDISVTLREGMPTWPGSAGFSLESTHRIGAGSDANVSRLVCDVHVGTHVDAPCHFVPGAAGADELPLELLIGQARVADVGDADAITPEILAALGVAGCRRLLLRTRNSALWGQPQSRFREDFVALTADAARWVVANGIQLIGVDYLSVQRHGDGPATHQVLLAAQVVVVEGLDLRMAAPGDYELTCLPLKLAGADGAPARAVLRPLDAAR